MLQRGDFGMQGHGAERIERMLHLLVVKARMKRQFGRETGSSCHSFFINQFVVFFSCMLICTKALLLVL